ncbi:prolyl 3-hydroxylase 1-like [Bolinopsis microptera]|uniref:prolyl 3-hydroxylase 1-like n=1 Tax=Bolinopsis microptera TaxID=2820187 RepID=UPI003079DC0F
MQDGADTAYSYTLLHTRNPTINDNIELYSSQFGVKGTSRQDIQGFLNNHRIDMELLEKTDSKQQPREESVFRTDNSFGDKGFLSTEECNTLVYFAKEVSTENDGYDHFKDKGSSPFSSNEKYSGIELSRAIELLEGGQVEAEAVQLYLSVVEAAKSHLEKKFKLVKPLYFNYIHLVQRSAIEGSEKVSEYSHPIHADNCVIKPDGSCIKESPAFTERDWSAVVYLNSPVGGEFVITNNKYTVTESLQPSCGNIVGFSAETFHGVKAVEKGERYAIGLWFTHQISRAVDMVLLQRRIDNAKEKNAARASKDEL